MILAFVSGLQFNTWSYSKLSSTRKSVDEMLKEKRVNVHVVNDLATNNNTDLMYTIFTLLLTSNSDLAINRPKSPIIFLYFRHEPINKFNATLRWRPPLVRVQVTNLPRKTDFPLINYKTKGCVILIHWPTLFLVVDTRSIGSTVVRSQIYATLSLDSDVNKSLCERQTDCYWLSEIILERVCRLSEVTAVTLE